MLHFGSTYTDSSEHTAVHQHKIKLNFYNIQSEAKAPAVKMVQYGQLKSYLYDPRAKGKICFDFYYLL